jgi:hypothetical protein
MDNRKLITGQFERGSDDGYIQNLVESIKRLQALVVKNDPIPDPDIFKEKIIDEMETLLANFEKEFWEEQIKRKAYLDKLGRDSSFVKTSPG